MHINMNNNNGPWSDWKQPNGWKAPHHVHIAGLTGWPAIFLLFFLVWLLAGPVLGLAFFMIKLALMVLPYVIVGGLMFMGVRYLMRTMGYSARWSEFGSWGKHHDWNQYRRLWEDRKADAWWGMNNQAEKQKNSAADKRKNGDSNSDIFYV
jgi:hypothetical protein